MEDHFSSSMKDINRVTKNINTQLKSFISMKSLKQFQSLFLPTFLSGAPLFSNLLNYKVFPLSSKNGSSQFLFDTLTTAVGKLPLNEALALKHPVISPTMLPLSHPTGRNWTIDIGQAAILSEAVIFFVIGILSLFQVRILMGSKQPRQETTGWPRSTTHRNSTSSGITSRPVSLTGGKTRALFIALLCISNFVRAISLVLIGLWLNPGKTEEISSYNTDDFPVTDPREWDLYLLQTFPALLFLSTYSVVVLFWAQVYYATLLVSVPLLRPAFIFLNLAALLTFITIAILTRSLGAYIQFRNYSLCFVGALHLFIGAMFVYFGIQVAAQFAHQEKGSQTRDSIIRRVVFLSVICPLIFALRGAMSLCFVFELISSYHPSMFSRLSWDALVFVATELIPDILILGSFWSTGRASIQSCSSGSTIQNGVQAPLLDGKLLDELRASLDHLSTDRHPHETTRWNQQNLQITDALNDPDFCIRPPNYFEETNRQNFGSYKDEACMIPSCYNPPTYSNRYQWDVSQPQIDPWGEVGEARSVNNNRGSNHTPTSPILHGIANQRCQAGTTHERSIYPEHAALHHVRPSEYLIDGYGHHQEQSQLLHPSTIPGDAEMLTYSTTCDSRLTTHPQPDQLRRYRSPLETDLVRFGRKPHSTTSSSSSTNHDTSTWGRNKRQGPQSLRNIPIADSQPAQNRVGRDKNISRYPIDHLKERQVVSCSLRPPKSQRTPDNRHNRRNHNGHYSRGNNYMNSAPTCQQGSKRKVSSVSDSADDLY